MACNDTHKCCLSPILHDLRKNSDDDHREATRLEWEALLETRIENGDEFDSADHDLFHCLVTRTIMQ